MQGAGWDPVWEDQIPPVSSSKHKQSGAWRKGASCGRCQPAPTTGMCSLRHRNKKHIRGKNFLCAWRNGADKQTSFPQQHCSAATIPWPQSNPASTLTSAADAGLVGGPWGGHSFPLCTSIMAATSQHLCKEATSLTCSHSTHVPTTKVSLSPEICSLSQQTDKE